MANHRAVIAAVLVFCLCFVQVARCDVVAAAVSPSSPEQAQELQMLRAKVASLELRSLGLEDEISGRKEETLQLENVVREKSAQIAALVSELEVLQVPNVADDESVLKANAHNEMLEKQVLRLGSDLEDQVKKGESLEARASEAEKSLLELTQKLDHAEKINMEQKKKIEELNHSLRQVQDKLFEVEREAKLKAEELMKVHGMWLPHWVMARFVYCQDLASDKWQLHGKPVLDALAQKESKKFTTPYITKVVAASEPRLSRVCAVLEPYTRPVISAWRKLVMSASVPHRQVQKGIKHFVNDNGLLKSDSADRFAWFTASALVALPMFYTYKMLSAAIWRKAVAAQGSGGTRSKKASNRRRTQRMDS
ncbi:hypothetical protein EE612_025422 [Oryza sativa]|nr:hypothetical protein EE612_025422 [Oryza sativa]